MMSQIRRRVIRKRAYLQERRGLRRAHPPDHGFKQLRQHRQHGLASSTQEVDDEVTNDEPAGLVLALQLLRDDFQNAVQAGLPGCSIRPGDELVDVLPND